MNQEYENTVPAHEDDEANKINAGKNMQGALEALLFVSGDPIAVNELARALSCDEHEAQICLESMAASYQTDGRGIQLRWVNGKAQLCSNPVYIEQIETLLQPTQRKKFSQSVIETLSIIAYKQPVTRTEIETVRGVRCEYSINQLQNLHLIEEVGRKQCIGRPALFATTDAFLALFDLPDLDALPHKELFDEAAAELLEEIDV